MRKFVSFLVLLKVWLFSRFFYRHERGWIGDKPPDAWSRIRLICFLNHTSLFEPLFAGIVPIRFLWDIASRAVVPAADKTLERPVFGRFLSLLVRHPVSITREPDHTWQAVLQRIEEDSMVVILPEGRMRRATGLDKHGKPMTARGGIADILDVLTEGRMLFAYSGGLHHVQIPGQRFPRLFQTIRMNLELVQIESYRETMQTAAESESSPFKEVVKKDLDRRRDEFSPADDKSTTPHPA